MLKNENIICISSIDWDFLWQQHQAIMSRLANQGNRILFIENTGVRSPLLKDIPRIRKRLSNWLKSTKGFKKALPNLYLYSPIIIPFPYSWIARRINRFLLLRALKRWMKVAEFNNPIIWTFLPTPLVLDMVENIPHKLFLYYCTDNFSATSKMARKIVKSENKTLSRADLVFVMSKNLLKRCRSYNQNTTSISMGVDITVFEKTLSKESRPKEIRGIDKTIIGYIGGIRDCIDQQLVAFLAQRLPDFVFVFVGPIQEDVTGLRKFGNILFIGEKKHQELPDYLRFFDLCIIPYKKNEYTDNVSSAKLNEYLAMGKPVVSSNLKEVSTFSKENGDILYIADSYEYFLNLISVAIKDNNQELIDKRMAVAKQNSWDKKIDQMSGLIAQAIKVRQKESVRWRSKFLGIYKGARRKFSAFILSVLIFLGILFYTPLLWGIGDFLLISQKPKQAQAIVVFAGGVGESGKAGQGFDERVEYAADLYKSGYAESLIFSSGYKHALKETELMKALAVSLGVPADRIILEDQAKNTYENVIYSKAILDQHHWNKILLISSPYHMLRSQLVFRKAAKDIEVIYTPIPESLFYARKGTDLREKKTLKTINLKQIKGILHEYLGIVYYWFKGYI